MISKTQIEHQILEHIQPLIKQMVDEALNERLPEIMALLAKEKQDDSKG